MMFLSHNAGWLLLACWIFLPAFSKAATESASGVSIVFVDGATGFSIEPEQVVARHLLSGATNGLATQVKAGKAALWLEQGPNEITVSAHGYEPAAGKFEMTAGGHRNIRFVLDPLELPIELTRQNIAADVCSEAMLIQGYVADSSTGRPIAGARVHSSRGVSATSDTRGFFRFLVPVDGGSDLDYATSLVFEREGFQSQERQKVEIWPGGDWTYQVSLLPGTGAVAIDESLSRRRTPASPAEPSRTSGIQSVAPVPDSSSSPYTPLATELTNSTVRVPRQIRVLTSDNTTIDYVSMNYYARAVLASEWIPSWGNATGGSNSLNAGAVAVRCYAIAKINAAASSSTYDICATTSCQVYNPTKMNSLTDVAVNYTENYVVVTSSGVIPSTEYSAENNQLGQSCGDGFTAPTSGCLYDPVCSGESEYGHGRGMCQWGTARWATGRRMAGRVTGDATPNGYPRRDWVWMVQHYYPGNLLVKGQPLLLGDTVRPLKTLDVRSCAGGSITNGVSCPLVTTRNTSMVGTIIGGPARVSNDATRSGFNWYQVQWNDGVTGWSVENYLERVFFAPANAPAPFVVSPAGTNRINLAWSDNNQAETGYTVERALSALGPWYLLVTLPQNTGFYADQSVSPGNTWFYRVRAFNPAGSSPYSVVMSGSIAPPAPVMNPVSPRTVTEGLPLTVPISAVVSDTRQTLVDLEPFLTEAANGIVLFRYPRFSGSTSANLSVEPNIAAVTDTFPPGNGTGKALRIACNFTNAANAWLRLTTAGSAYWPNPVIDLNQKLAFSLWCDRPIRVALGIREAVIAPGTAPGADGGTSGGIEWVGVTNSAGAAPVPSRLVQASNWTALTFDFPDEPVRNFSAGNGLLNTASGLAVMEHLAIVPSGTGIHNIYLDNFAGLKKRTVAFALGNGAPDGSALNASSGAFAWTPSEAQGPGTYHIPVLLSDNSTPASTSSNWFAVSVLESNLPPVLDPVKSRTVHAGTLVLITNSASDPDLPLQTLTYSLEPGAPAGAGVESATGIFSWHTHDFHAGTTWNFSITVQDSFAAPAVASHDYSITVLPRPSVTAITIGQGEVSFTWASIPGTRYQVQYRDSLEQGAWQNAGIILTAAHAASFSEALNLHRRFYRVVVEQ